MAEGKIGWSGLNLHIENFVPGILIVGELSLIFDSFPKIDKLPEQGFIAGAFFIAASYAIGIVSSLLSRIIIDWLSERGVRAIVFPLFSHKKRKDIVNEFKTEDDYRKDYIFEKITYFEFIREWNAVYRYALRKNPSDEVNRRRAQGRLIRGLFFPTILTACLLSNNNWIWSLAGALIILFLYAYAEYMNMAEAYDMSPISKDNDSNTNEQ